MAQPEMTATLEALGCENPPHDSGTGRYERRKFRCINPTHDDPSPSATVRYGEAPWYNCFGCELDCNPIGLIMAVHGLDVADAYRWASEHVEGFTNDGSKSVSK